MKFRERSDEELAIISKDVINLLAKNNLTVAEAECVLEKSQRGISNTSKVRRLEW